MKMKMKMKIEFQETENYNSESPSLDLDIRESMQKDLPATLQPFLTWLTGKPFSGQKPWRRTPIDQLMTALMAIILGVLISVFSLTQSNFF